MESRILQWLSRCVTGLLLAALVAGIFLPVYTDEVGWRFQERAGFDGVDKMFSEVCGLHTLAAPPWFMMPVRWYSAFFNAAFADPLWIRVSGILYAVLWVALAITLVGRLTQDSKDRAVISTIGIGLVALGTMPLVMVWSRPEQPIALAATAALLVALPGGAISSLPQSSAREAWLRSLTILVLTCIAISYHVKGLFLLPLMLACLLFASRGPKARLAKLAAGLLMLAAVGSAMSYWSSRLSCPENAVLAKAYGDNNIAGEITQIRSLDDAVSLTKQMIENTSIFQYVSNIAPRPFPLSDWLAENQVSRKTSYNWFLALTTAWSLALLLAGAAAAISALRDIRNRQIDPRLILAVVTIGVAMAWSAMQPMRNVYETKFVLLLLILAIMLALSTANSGRLKAWMSAGAALIGLFAIASPIAIGATYGPSLASAARQSGRVEAQPFSVSVFGYGQLKPDIEAASRVCGIGKPSKARAVMVDDVTYFIFMRSSLPQHELGVIRGWNGKIKDPVGYLKSRHSDGAVVSCGILGSKMRSRSKRVGKFCCLGPPSW